MRPMRNAAAVFGSTLRGFACWSKPYTYWCVVNSLYAVMSGTEMPISIHYEHFEGVVVSILILDPLPPQWQFGVRQLWL